MQDFFLNNTDLPGDIFIRKVSRFCDENDMIQQGDRILLLLSAGKDSMALLFFCLQRQQYLDFEIGVFHLNHGVRGKDSDDDEKFIREISENYKLKSYFSKAMVDLSKPGFEERARIIRYENAEKILGSDKYTKIFTAHTLSDQTETILMRLFTGTHIHGLKGIPVRRGVILRPFLCVSAEEVISFLKRYEIPWREDLSNNDCRYTRNYLRNRLIPEIQTRFPRSGTTIADITLAASENERLILQLVGKLGINKKKSPGVIEYEFDNQDISYELFSWMIAKIFRQCNHFCSRERVDESWKRFRTVAKTSELYESAGLLIEKDYRNEKKIIRGVTGNALNPDLPNGRIIVTSNPRAVHIDSNAQYLLDAVFVDYDTLENRSEDNVLYIETAVDSEIEIRGVHDGDRILLNGSFKKLKYIVNDRACSRREKKALPVFLINGNIAAIGFSFIKRGTCRIADPYLVQAGSKKILAISGRHIENEV